MSDRHPDPEEDPRIFGGAADPARLADWEAFYRDFRKPGYIEGFEITTKLGGGVFGQVFRARRMSIGKDYAIKFLKVEDGDVRRAVLSELEQVKYFAQVDHPNLVSIEDRGEVDGIPYIVMAFAGTETLRDLMVADRAPTEAEKASLMQAFVQTARGLQALHARSLVHFDVKPANVFIKGGVARLGDYGLSKLVTHSRGSLSMGRGTPYYMAPEMLHGRGDERSDVYSMGVMLYELLCGEVPFAGDSGWAVLRQHETASPDMPGHLTELERDVLNRCLAKDPARRFASVQALLDAIGSATCAAAQVGSGTLSSPEQNTDAYRDLAAASKNVIHHACRAARTALRDASAITANAVKTAQTLDDDRGHDAVAPPVRPLAFDHELVQKAPPLPAGAARAQPERRGRPEWVSTVVWVVGAAVVALVLFVTVGLGLVVHRWLGGVSPEIRLDLPYERPVASFSSERVYSIFEVPLSLRESVTATTPRWVTLADLQPDEARRLLRERLRSWGDSPLLHPKERRSSSLPKFGLSVDAWSLDVVIDEVRQLMSARGDVDAFADAVRRRGAVGLAVCADVMAEIAYDDPRDLVAAKRLHRFLCEATSSKNLEFVETSSLDKARSYNRPVAALWAWFVNEFAHSEQAWQAYTRLLRVR